MKIEHVEIKAKTSWHLQILTHSVHFGLKCQKLISRKKMLYLLEVKSVSVSNTCISFHIQYDDLPLLHAHLNGLETIPSTLE